MRLHNSDIFMKFRAFAIAAIGIIISAALPVHSHAQDDGINWISSYHEGLRQAKVSGKPILLTFRCVP